MNSLFVVIATVALAVLLTPSAPESFGFSALALAATVACWAALSVMDSRDA